MSKKFRLFGENPQRPRRRPGEPAPEPEPEEAGPPKKRRPNPFAWSRWFNRPRRPRGRAPGEGDES